MKPGDMEPGSVKSVSAFHPCWTVSQLWDTPPAAEALHLLWKITAPTPGWWGKMVPVARLRGAWYVACTPHRKGQPYESRLCAPSTQRARGARKALNENVSSQRMNGKYSRFSFFTDSMLLIKFTYLLIFVCDPRSIGTVLSQSFADTHRAVKILSYPKHAFPADGGQGVALPSRLSSHTYTVCCLLHLLVPSFSHFCRLFVWRFCCFQ